MLRPIATGWLMWSCASTMGHLFGVFVDFACGFVVWFNGHMFIPLRLGHLLTAIAYLLSGLVGIWPP